MRLAQGQVRPVVAGLPGRLGEMLTSPDRDAVDRAMQAMFGMKKLDIAALQAAFDGAS